MILITKFGMDIASTLIGHRPSHDVRGGESIVKIGAHFIRGSIFVVLSGTLWGGTPTPTIPVSGDLAVEDFSNTPQYGSHQNLLGYPDGSSGFSQDLIVTGSLKLAWVLAGA